MKSKEDSVDSGLCGPKPTICPIVVLAITFLNVPLFVVLFQLARSILTRRKTFWERQQQRKEGRSKKVIAEHNRANRSFGPHSPEIYAVLFALHHAA